MHSELEFERLYLVQDVFKNKLNAKLMCSGKYSYRYLTPRAQVAEKDKGFKEY